VDAVKIPIRRHIEDERLELGIVRANGVKVSDSSDELRFQIELLVSDLLKFKDIIPPDIQAKVRNMMKIGGYSPSGRNRPASEFLLRELAQTGSFKYINNIVDINNYLSMKTMLPMSIFDTGRMNGAVVIRIGDPGEGYVFNNEGQVVDVKRLIVCCEEQPDYTSIPIGSPVKDSMQTKIFQPCEQLLAVIYSTPAVYSTKELITICTEMENLLKDFTEAKETMVEIR
jgi:DNA/RNA-binding domain of Phe-tRNA-synthetase-like protein